MEKIYCNECGKDVKPEKGKCPNCGMKFDNDVLDNDITFAPFKNTVSMSLKILSFIVFIAGFFLSIFHFGSILAMLVIVLLCLLLIALAEIIQICHDIRYKIYKK